MTAFQGWWDQVCSKTHWSFGHCLLSPCHQSAPCSHSTAPHSLQHLLTFCSLHPPPSTLKASLGSPCESCDMVHIVHITAGPKVPTFRSPWISDPPLLGCRQHTDMTAGEGEEEECYYLIIHHPCTVLYSHVIKYFSTFIVQKMCCAWNVRVKGISCLILLTIMVCMVQYNEPSVGVGKSSQYSYYLLTI